MGWHKTSHEGRVMWEDSSGQRVSDVADIPDFRKRESTPTETPIELGSVGTFVAGLIIGIVIGCLIGMVITWRW